MEEIEDEEDALDPPISNPSHDILSSSNPPHSSDFTSTDDHYNLLYDRINSLTSSVKGLQTTAHDLQNSVDGLTTLLHQVLASQEALNARFDSIFPSLPPPEY